MIGVRGELGEDFRRGATIAVSDVQTDQRLSDDDRAKFRSQQIAALVGVARFKDGRMVAAFGANHPSAVSAPIAIHVHRIRRTRVWSDRGPGNRP